MGVVNEARLPNPSLLLFTIYLILSNDILVMREYRTSVVHFNQILHVTKLIQISH